jgi:hypothetical protein
MTNILSVLVVSLPEPPTVEILKVMKVRLLMQEQEHRENFCKMLRKGNCHAQRICKEPLLDHFRAWLWSRSSLNCCDVSRLNVRRWCCTKKAGVMGGCSKFT